MPRGTFKVATFNANSIRSRMPLILDWLQEHQPDVACFQETKVQDAEFPAAPFREAGYHVVFRGQKGYAGVAVASREEPQDVAFGLDDGGEPDEARLARVTVRGIPIVNTYVPQGHSPD
ncbi:MAG: exodeoxyribonuclease III, partial [Anaerolineae bacterium]